MFKKALRLISIIAVVVTAWNFKLVLYGINQLSGQLHIIRNAKPVESVLSDQSVSNEVKQKLRLINEIKTFAVDSIGLEQSDNYSTFFDQQDKPVLWVLTACPPFKMKEHEWWFPFLGKVSYKGFFKKDKGEKEFLELKKKGFDADLSTVSAWSTLGWFSDPVLSNMLKRKTGVLAETIIHEMTHATIFLKSNVELNENLATFTGEKGAEKFLEYRFGKKSKELIDYRQYKSDEELYGKHMLHGAVRLDSLYREFEMLNLSQREKSKRKYKLIASIFLEANNLPLFNKNAYRFGFKGEPLPNNTFFLSYQRYRSSQAELENLFEGTCNGNLKEFIRIKKAEN